MRNEPDGLSCEYAGHSWRNAGGGLLICALCETERWDDEDNPCITETCLSDRDLYPGEYS